MFAGARWLRPGHARPTLVVLPFENVGPPGDAYFADGIGEEITTRLARVSGLQVVARNSALRFRESGRTAQDFGRELGADYVLDGTVRWEHAARGPSRVRVTPALIRVANAHEVWGQTYDADVSDVFRLQSEIAEQVTGALQVTLGADERRNLRASGTRDLGAYEDYVLGRYEWRKRTGDALQEAARHFTAALAHDPDYARAWSGLADAVGLYPTYGVTAIPPSVAYDSAERAADRAIALDSRSAEAHASLGAILENGRWDWAGAEREFRTAIALDPDYATAHQWHGEVLNLLGRVREGIAEVERAVELDPLAPVMQNVLGMAYYCAGRYRDAVAAFRQSLVLQPDYPGAPGNLVRAFIAQGDYDSARAAQARISPLPPWADTLLRALAEPAFRTAHPGLLDAHAADVSDLEPFTRLQVYASFGRRDAAFAVLDSLISSRNEQLLYCVGQSPILEPLHADPRWRQALTRMGLP